MGFTRFYWVLLGFTGFHWVSQDFTMFYWVSLGFTGFLLGFTGFHWVLLGFTGFYWVGQSSYRFEWWRWGWRRCRRRWLPGNGSGRGGRRSGTPRPGTAPAPNCRWPARPCASTTSPSHNEPLHPSTSSTDARKTSPSTNQKRFLPHSLGKWIGRTASTFTVEIDFDLLMIDGLVFFFQIETCALLSFWIFYWDPNQIFHCFDQVWASFSSKIRQDFPAKIGSFKGFYRVFTEFSLDRVGLGFQGKKNLLTPSKIRWQTVKNR